MVEVGEYCDLPVRGGGTGRSGWGGSGAAGVLKWGSLWIVWVIDYRTLATYEQGSKRRGGNLGFGI